MHVYVVTLELSSFLCLSHSHIHAHIGLDHMTASGAEVAASNHL